MALLSYFYTQVLLAVLACHNLGRSHRTPDVMAPSISIRLADLCRLCVVPLGQYDYIPTVLSPASRVPWPHISVCLQTLARYSVF